MGGWVDSEVLFGERLAPSCRPYDASASLATLNASQLSPNDFHVSQSLLATCGAKSGQTRGLNMISTVHISIIAGRKAHTPENFYLWILTLGTENQVVATQKSHPIRIFGLGGDRAFAGDSAWP